MADLTDLRLNYRNQLRPMLEMIKFESLTLKGEDCINFVKRTKESILSSPSQYLANLAERESLEKVINQIFEEFVTELKYPKPTGNLQSRLGTKDSDHNHGVI